MSVPNLPDFDYVLVSRHLGETAVRFDIDWLPECDSTNTRLLERATQGAASGLVLGADRQTGGRGRRGRSWSASPECSLTFSLLWRLPAPAFDGLSLATGLAVVNALEKLGARPLQLKWPNDIWFEGRKLSGVLIEVARNASTPLLVIGIGLNLRHDPAWQNAGEPSWANLTEAGLALPREVILGTVLRELAHMLENYSRDGFSPLRESWDARNALQGQRIRVSTERGSRTGICGNVNADGSLNLVCDNGSMVPIHHGDVSIRPMP